MDAFKCHYAPPCMVSASLLVHQPEQEKDQPDWYLLMHYGAAFIIVNTKPLHENKG